MLKLKVFLYYRTYWAKDSKTGWLGKNVLASSKMEMVNTCLKSMEFDRLDNSIMLHKIACVDNSTPEYTKHLESHFDEIFHTSEGLDVSDTHKGWFPLWGMRGALVRLMYLIERNNHSPEDIILIVEDDYLFRENGFEKWINACSHFHGFVTPYDHPYNYFRNDMFLKIDRIDTFEGIHWRETTCNTSVVGGRYKYFKKSYLFRKIPRIVFGPIYLDRLLGRELPSIDILFYRRIRRFLGVKVYSPMPGLAQHLSRWPNVSKKHMKDGYETPLTELSPGVDWQTRYKNLIGPLDRVQEVVKNDGSSSY